MGGRAEKPWVKMSRSPVIRHKEAMPNSEIKIAAGTRLTARTAPIFAWESWNR